LIARRFPRSFVGIEWLQLVARPKDDATRVFGIQPLCHQDFFRRFRLRDLLRYNLKTVRAYLLKEDFQQLWEYNSPAWAAKFLDDWCQQVMRSRIEPMKKVARTLRAHRELILNYFRAKKQFSSGIVEGLNNKAKLTMRKAYGFRIFRDRNRVVSRARKTTGANGMPRRFPAKTACAHY
jgi:Transposase